MGYNWQDPSTTQSPAACHLAAPPPEVVLRPREHVREHPTPHPRTPPHPEIFPHHVLRVAVREACGRLLSAKALFLAGEPRPATRSPAF